jgi:hypothetical protein
MTKPLFLGFWPVFLVALAVRGYPQIDLTPVPAYPRDRDYPSDLVRGNNRVAARANGAAHSTLCSSIGIDYQNDGTYFIDSTMNDYFFFRSEFSGRR